MLRRRQYFLPLALFISLMVIACQSCRPEKFDKTKFGNCSDDIKNQNEEDVDCGGYCMPCASCEDGIKNAGETGVDCGGPCLSCTPPCTPPEAKIQYTIFPTASSTGYDGENDAYGSSYYQASNSEITVNFSNGTMVRMNFVFMKDFNPITSLALNETMVFKTVDNSSFSNPAQKGLVKVTYTGNFGFSGFSGSIRAGQSIYMTKISATDVRIQCCNIQSGGNDLFNLNTFAN
jgi:hypothetical protein